MAVHALSEHFDWFFRRINPSPTYTSIASSELNNVQALLQAADAPAAPLAPWVFAQGSYRQETAIHTINDLDVVELCTALTHPPVTTGWGGPDGRSFSRDEIFSLLASALARDHRYRGKIRYRDQSLCIKIDLSIKVEILPAVMRIDITDVDGEPFRIYRPERGEWVDAYARYHRTLMSAKNAAAGGRYIPMVKVLKHLRDTWPGFDPDDAISFHLECLLYHVPNALFFGTVAHVIAQVLGWIVAFPKIEQSGPACEALVAIRNCSAARSGYTTPTAGFMRRRRRGRQQQRSLSRRLIATRRSGGGNACWGTTISRGA